MVLVVNDIQNSTLASVQYLPRKIQSSYILGTEGPRERCSTKSARVRWHTSNSVREYIVLYTVSHTIVFRTKVLPM